MQTDDDARTVSNDTLLERGLLEQEVARWRMRAEQAESILRTSPAAIFLFDRNEERSRTFNHAVAQMLGYDPEHFTPSADGCQRDRMHPDDTSRIAMEIERDLESLRDGEQLVFEYRMRHRHSPAIGRAHV